MLLFSVWSIELSLDIEMELRIYQYNEILYHNPTAEDIAPIMDNIITFDKSH